LAHCCDQGSGVPLGGGYDARALEYSFDVPLPVASSHGRLRSQVPIIPPALRPPKSAQSRRGRGRYQSQHLPYQYTRQVVVVVVGG
jgi:hypothetical protein